MNGIPIAKDDLSYITAVDTALVVSSGNNLLLNDWDPEGSSLTASIVANPANGSVSNFSGSAGTFTYTPNTSYSGVDTFTYKVNDGTADSPTVRVAIAVGGHFGPRTNLEESPLIDSMPSGCEATSTPIRFEASCLTGDLRLAQALTPGMQLVYNSGALPKPIVVLETFLQSTSSVPDEIKATLTFNGTAGTNYSYSTTGLQAGNSLRFALQADATSLSTGRYAYTVTLTARFDTTEVTRDYTGHALVVNRGSSTYEFGRGWQLAGLDKLVSATGGMMLVRSSGEALWFADNGSGGYLRADGDSTFSSLVKNGDNSFTLTTKHSDKSNFSSAGLLTSLVDRNNNTTSVTYTSGLVTQITDPFSRNTTLSYTNGRRTSLTDYASRTATLAYDANGRLSTVTQPDPDSGGPLTSPVWTFAYDATIHQLTQLTNPLNHAAQFANGSHNRLTTITHPDTNTWQITPLQTIGMPTGSSGNTLVAANPVGTTTNERSKQSTFRTDRFGRITEWNDPNSYQTLIARTADGLPGKITPPDPDGAGSLTSPVTILGFDVLGNLKYQKNPDNSTKTWSYSSTFNFVTSATDELNRTQSFGYDTSGNRTSSTDPAGFVTSATYTTRGLVASTTDVDPDGAGPLTSAVTSLAYDTNGRPTTLTNPDSSTRVYTYDSADNRLTDRDDLLHTTSFAYDLLGRVTSTTNRVNAATSFTYNALGLVTKVTDALSNATDYEYNNRNFLTKAIQPDPDGAGSLSRPETTYGYDAVGNLTSMGQPTYFGVAFSQTFDNADRLTRTRKMLDSVPTDIDYTYDNLGRLTKVTDPLAHETAYTYSNRSWVTKITGHDPDGSGSAVGPVTEYVVDAAGQTTSVTDPRGFVTSTSYDARGLPVTVSQPDPDGTGPQWAAATYYSYDNVGRLKSIDDPLCRMTTYAWSSRDWLTSVTLPDPDGAGSLTSPVWGIGYDVVGRQTSVTDPLSHVTSYTYNSQTLLSKFTDPLSHDTTFQYDGFGRRSGVTDHQSHQTTYSFNKVNLVTSVTLPDPDGAGSLTSPVTAYAYDVYNRLTGITDPLDGVITFTYDKADNLLTVTDPEANVTTYAYDNIGRLTIETNELDDARSWTYDPASNLTRRVDRNGRVLQFVRDNLDRITAEQWYSGGTPTPSVAIAATTEGGPVNEVQRVGFSATMLTGGTFTLSFNGSTTSAIAYNASAATVQSAMEGLASVGTGNVSVTKLQNSTTAQEWQLIFQGTLSGTNVVQTTVNSASVTSVGSVTNIQATDTTGAVNNDTTGAVNNEVQTVALSNANGGTMRLAFLGQITPPLNWNATASEIDTALENLNTVDQVTVTGNAAGPWTVTFVGTHSGLNVAKLNGDTANATGGTLQRTISYVYDAADRLTSASDPDSGYDYTYDNLDRVLTVDNDDTPDLPRVVLTNAYDASSNRTSVSATIDSTNDFLNSYTYDGLNRLTRVDQIGQSGGNTVAEKRVDFSYNSVGQFTEIARFKDTDGGSSNEIATSAYTYDSLNRLTGLAHKKNSTNLFTPYSYTYDNLSNPLPLPPLPRAGEGRGEGGPGMDPRVAALAQGAVFSGLGRITQVTSADGTTDYTYDGTSQLTGADHSYQADETYSYDSNGNRTMTGYSTGTNNQLLNDGTYSYQYDDEGNRTRRTKTSDSSYTEYTWDYRNRLTKATNRNSSDQISQVVEYKYDVFDRRISRAVDTTSPFDLADAAIERYVLDDLNGVASLNGGNVVLDFVDPDGTGSQSIALSKRYLHGNAVDQILAQEDVTKDLSSADRVLWPLVDHLQTVRDVARRDSTIASHYKYDSFGRITSGDTSLTRFLFTSRDLDPATGQQYNRARWIDAPTGNAGQLTTHWVSRHVTATCIVMSVIQQQFGISNSRRVSRPEAATEMRRQRRHWAQLY